MLHLSPSCRYFYYNGIADMRKGAYSLSGLVRNKMHLDVLSGDVFIFIGRRANKIKLLQWDAGGFALYEKGLERGSFERPVVDEGGHFSISAIAIHFTRRCFKERAASQAICKKLLKLLKTVHFRELFGMVLAYNYASKQQLQISIINNFTSNRKYNPFNYN